MIHCFVLLKRFSKLAELLNVLLQGNYFQRVVAAQIAFDLEDLADQNLASSVADLLVVNEEKRNDIN